jgi:hypothetical protein
MECRGDKYDVGKMGYGNCRAVETVEKRTACFPTVPTALGKLGKKQLRRVFHSSHSPYYYLLYKKKDKNSCSHARLVRFAWTIRSHERKNHLVPADSLYGRF